MIFFLTGKNYVIFRGIHKLWIYSENNTGIGLKFGKSSKFK